MNDKTNLLYTEKAEKNYMQLLNTKQAAEILGLSPDTLTLWRSVGRYNLKYVRSGRLIRYRMCDLLDFIESRTQTHTGEDR